MGSVTSMTRQTSAIRPALADQLLGGAELADDLYSFGEGLGYG
jgi:hypothetical protein